MKKIILAAGLFIAFAGCTSKKNVYPPVTYPPTRLTEVNAMQRIAGEASAVYLLQFIKVYETPNPEGSEEKDTVRRLKQTAIYYAKRADFSDVFLSPGYIIETTNYGLWKQVNVKAVGIKGIVKGYKRL
jgi:hypothetical protein